MHAKAILARKRVLSRPELVALFLFSPAISLWVAFRNFRIPWSKDLMWAFTVFFGFTFVVSNQMDSTRYSEELRYLSGQYITSLGDFLGLIYETGTGYVDVLAPLLTFLVSRVTENERVLFAVFGLVYGYFYSRNLWFMFSFVEGKVRREAIPFLLLAALTIAIWQINGFRFWTAAHVFIFGFFTYVKGSKIKGVLISISALFVHFSFILPITVLLIYLLVGNRMIILMILYFASFFMTQVQPEALETYSNLVPEVFQERTEAYTNKEFIQEREKLYRQANWYVEGRVTAIHYAINLLLIILFVMYRREVSAHKVELGLLCFGLLFATVINLLSQIASMNRFYMVTDMILFTYFFLFVQGFHRRVFPRLAYLLFLFSAALYIIVEIRVGFETTSLLSVIGNPLVAPFLPNELPLISFFK